MKKQAIDQFYQPSLHAETLHQAVNGEAEYCHQLDFWTRSELLSFAEQLGLEDGAHILDLGSGLGGPACLWASELGYRVTGLDCVPYHVAKANDLAGSLRLSDRVRFLDLNLEADALPVAGADAAICIDCLVHIENLASLLSRLCLAVRDQAPLFFVFEVVSTGLDPALVAQREALGRVICRSREAYREAFIAAGLTIELDEYDPTRRAEFARKAIEWMEANDNAAAIPNMRAILDVAMSGHSGSNKIMARKSGLV